MSDLNEYSYQRIHDRKLAESIKNGDTTADFTASSIDMKSATINLTATGPVNIKGATVHIND